jgi:hypothetical protein
MANSVGRSVAVVAIISIAIMCTLARGADDPLPSWNEGATKQSILAFVAKVTTEGGPDFVRPYDRIATFDNDGTLWCEQPNYFQVMFAFDRIRATAQDHPDWKGKEPFQSVLDGNMQKLSDQGEKGLLDIMAATHTGMTVDGFHEIVRNWMHTARHPRFHQPFDKCTYLPMHELLVYLRANGFKTFIVSGGGIEFMRPWVDSAYGIPPEQVVGSGGVVKYELQNDLPVLMKEPKVEFVDDGPGKPIGINRFIGRHPIMAFGNSDGDYEMLRYTTATSTKRPAPRFGLIVHHTDAVREYAYDRDSKIGTLRRALDEAPARGWTVVDMKNDWKRIFAFEK